MCATWTRLRWQSATFFLIGIFSSACWGATTAERAEAARELVREALHREIYGLGAERDQLLTKAIELDPNCRSARWHRGYVRHGSQWLETGEFVERINQERRVAEYRTVRDRHPDTAAGQLALAQWCEDRGLTDRMRAHLTRVITIEPDHAQARLKLGFRRVDGRWVKPEEIQQAMQQRLQQQQDLQRWQSQIEEIVHGLSQRGLRKREKAAERLLATTDPAAIPAVETLMAGAGESNALLMIRWLAQMPGNEASLALARQAIVSSYLAVRPAAARALTDRARESFVPAMLSAMYTRVTLQSQVVQASNGRLLFRHTFLREGQEERQMLLVDSAFQRVGLPGGDVRDTATRAMAAAANDIVERRGGLVRHNLLTDELNDRIAAALNIATDQQLPADPSVWWDWWNETNEVFTVGEKPLRTRRETVEVAIIDRTSGLLPTNSGNDDGDSGSSRPPRRMDCLAAGTLVWTDRGPEAVESVRVGDLVLAQDPQSGELAYKPVLQTTVRPSGQLVRIELVNKRMFETSGGHLFWVSGDGWVKARDLRSGMELHTAEGTIRVSDVDDGSEQETYNLIVADFHSYFAGQDKVLSHDNTVRESIDLAVPGMPPRER